MQAFDQALLKQYLTSLDRSRLGIFAAGCATRGLFIFRGFPDAVLSTEGAELATLLESLWNNLSSGSAAQGQLSSNVSLLERMMPPELSSASLEYYADAIGSLLSATLAFNCGEAVYAVNAALAVQEIVARYIKQTCALDHHTGTAFLIEISSFPLMESECVRQLRDTQLLQTTSSDELRAACESIRSRALRENCLPTPVIERDIV